MLGVRAKMDEAEQTDMKLIIVFSDESRSSFGPGSVWVRMRLGQWKANLLMKCPLCVIVWG
jgi:hypothetical protein